MSIRHWRSIVSPVAFGGTHCLLVLLILYIAISDEECARAQGVREVSARDDAGAAAAFEALTPVLRHPRCMNCHSIGDFPRQGDDSHQHTMQVRRGPEGNGVNTIRCNTCHQTHNLAGLHMPPGAPDWRLPLPTMPMIWEGMTDKQLCELLKDPKKNGDRTPEQIVEHMHTPLVLWGWTPGDGRTPVPMAQREFLAKVKEWAAKGAACPPETTGLQKIFESGKNLDIPHH
jgi:hypothetical protein